MTSILQNSIEGRQSGGYKYSHLDIMVLNDRWSLNARSAVALDCRCVPRSLTFIVLAAFSRRS